MSKPAKQTRKRPHAKVSGHVDHEVDVPKPKFRPFTEEAAAEEEQLTKILFGGASSFLQSLEEAEQEAGRSAVDSGIGEDNSEDVEMDEDELKPAWSDDDDDGLDLGHALKAQGRKLPSGGVNDDSLNYGKWLRTKFAGSVGTPSWASLRKTKKDDSDSDDEVLRTCGFLRKGTSSSLPPSLLEFKKVPDLNAYSEGPCINSIEFHPSSSVALVGGNGGVATLYAVDGKRNDKLHSVAFEKFPIISAKFLNDGNEAILGSRQSHIFSYDLIAAKPVRIPLPTGLTQCKKFVVSPDSKVIAVAGKWGEVYLLSAASKERVALLKQNSEVTALAYSPRGDLLYGHSETGEVTVWDTNMKRVKHKFVDEGCLQGSTLAVSSSNQFLAAGSTQGVVNLYEVENVLRNKLPKPIKTIMNLTTGITDLKFNAASEILAMASADIPNSVKLFHVGSRTTFSNFPSFDVKLGRVNALNFSPNGGYVAFGNRKSTVALYRLKHYKSY